MMMSEFVQKDMQELVRTRCLLIKVSSHRAVLVHRHRNPKALKDGDVLRDVVGAAIGFPQVLWPSADLDDSAGVVCTIGTTAWT